MTPSLTPSAVSRPGSFQVDHIERYGRNPGDDEDDLSPERESPQLSVVGASSRPQGQGQGGGEEKKTKKAKNGKQPEYLCRNCGRNDSPEWRKVRVGLCIKDARLS